jgi:hypothetical protein
MKRMAPMQEEYIKCIQEEKNYDWLCVCVCVCVLYNLYGTLKLLSVSDRWNSMSTSTYGFVT